VQEFKFHPPVSILYRPAGHGTQVMAPFVLEYVPASHNVHVALPVTLLYFPATQLLHTPPFGPVNPRLQVQLASALQPLHEAPELAGHATQVAADVAPTVAEYLPVPQLVHAAELVVSL
jgi:hypothetical protein